MAEKKLNYREKGWDMGIFDKIRRVKENIAEADSDAMSLLNLMFDEKMVERYSNMDKEDLKKMFITEKVINDIKGEITAFIRFYAGKVKKDVPLYKQFEVLVKDFAKEKKYFLYVSGNELGGPFDLARKYHILKLLGI